MNTKIAIAAIVTVLFVTTIIVYPRLTLSQAAAAERAAICLGWPEEIASQVGANYEPSRELETPMSLLFAHATLVTVSWYGSCSPLQDTQLIAPPLRHSPPMARVPAERQDYFIYLVAGSARRGYSFVGVRAGSRILEIPDKKPSPTF